MQSKTKNSIRVVVGLVLAVALIVAVLMQRPAVTQDQVDAVKDRASTTTMTDTPTSASSNRSGN